MKIFKPGLYLAPFLFGLLACAPKESIEPSFEILKDSKQSFHFQYQRSDEILSPTLEFENLSPIGGIIRNLANAIADILLEEEDELVPVEPITYYLPSNFQDFDLKKINSVKMQRVFIRLKNQDGPTAGSLGFIKKAEIFMKAGFETQAPPVIDILDQTFESDFYDNQRLDQDVILGNKVPDDAKLVLSYERGLDKLACNNRCLDMKISPIDFKSLITKGYTSYSIYFRFVIDAIPRESLELESVIDIRIEADLLK